MEAGQTKTACGDAKAQKVIALHGGFPVYGETFGFPVETVVL
jgi:hypothetical protein